jgi:hypothetical protein
MSGECVIYRPFVVDESVIVSGPPDAEAQVFDVAGNYQSGDEVWYGGHAYRSLMDNNTDDTSVEASWKDLGEVDNGATAWASGSYDIQDPPVFYVRNHRLYTTAVDANTTEPGTTAGSDKWQDFGPTNRYRAFDENLARFSASVGLLKWVLQFTDSAIHSVAFSPIGTEVNLRKVAGGSTIYDETRAVIADGDVSYWGYFFVEPARKSSVLFDDMTAIPEETITFEVSGGADETVAVSGVHFGRGVEVGPVVTGGTGLETKGFVSIQFDEFGNLVSPARPKQQITRFTTRPIIRQTGYLHSQMNEYSQRPCIAFMRDGEDFGLLAWGVLDDHVFDMPNPAIAELAVKIKGFPQ